MLFYLVDILFLRRSRLLYFQRWFYLVAIALSLLLPLLSFYIPLLHQIMDEASLPTFTISYEIPVETISKDSMLFSNDQTLAPLMWSYPWWMSLIKVVWLLGFGIMGIRILIGYLSLYKILRDAERRKIGEISLFITKKDITPFTFNNKIVVSSTISEGPIFYSILKHELEHIHQKHFWDLSFGVLLQLLQWWNPFAWGLLHQQRNTLEFLADQGVLNSGILKKDYQLHLLQGSLGRSLELPQLSFSVQNLKKRMMMMNNQKKNRRWAGLLCALSSLPIAALLLLSTQLINTVPAIAKETAPFTNEVVIEASQELDVPMNSAIQTPDEDPEEVHNFVEQIPSFPGGQNAMNDWLKENLIFPKEVINSSGVVYVRFIIEKDGSTSNVKVFKGVNEYFDNEARRVIEAMPKWNPGYDKGKPVRVRFTLPIHFTNASSKDASVQKEDRDINLDAIQAYIYPKIRFTEETKDLEGRIQYSVDIDRNGAFKNVYIRENLHPHLDAEVKRILSSMNISVLGLKNTLKGSRLNSSIYFQKK